MRMEGQLFLDPTAWPVTQRRFYLCSYGKGSPGWQHVLDLGPKWQWRNIAHPWKGPAKVGQTGSDSQGQRPDWTKTRLGPQEAPR